MKRGIFNQYVDFVCKECGITREELFTKSRKTKLAMSRYLLYSICYQRPMTIVQIVDLMHENNYEMSRTNVEYGISKIKEMNDGDVNDLISIAVNNISKEQSLC